MTTEKKATHAETRHARMIEGAQRFAQANKSDPFAYGRAVAHINSGVAQWARQDGMPAFYDAHEVAEERSLVRSDGSVMRWTATAYRNQICP